jgi:membrane protein YqaA with SNARE-associated domain
MLGELVAALRVWADGAGATGVFVLAVLDSSLLALPNATDALIIYLSIQHPALWWYYAATATAGAVIGSWPIYLLAKRGGEAFLERRLSGPRSVAAVNWYRRSAFWAIAIPAFVPPPMPLKIFILLAGATAFSPWRVAAAIMLGRGARHASETWLAVWYGDDAVRAVTDYGLSGTIVMTASLGVVGLAVYLWQTRSARRGAVTPRR